MTTCKSTLVFLRLVRQASFNKCLNQPGEFLGKSYFSIPLLANALLAIPLCSYQGQSPSTLQRIQLPGTVPEHSASHLLAFDPSLVGDSPRVFHRAIASNLHRKMWGQSPG
jgi:hypothetical protein